MEIFINFLLLVYILIGVSCLIGTYFQFKSKNNKNITNINFVVRTISFIFFSITVIFIYFLFNEIIYAGIPDGYITDYKKSILPFYKIAIFLYLLTSLIFFALIILFQKTKINNYIFFINLAITFIVTIGIFIILPNYFGVYLNLDNGHGG